MAKLNNVTVSSARKIKVDKELFDVKLTDTGIVYVARMAESKKEVKVVLDEYTIKKSGSGFSITLMSDAFDIVSYNKTKKTLTNVELLDYFAPSDRIAYPLKTKVEKLCDKFADFQAIVDKYDFVIVAGEYAACNFVRRYIAITRPLIAEQANAVMDKIPNYLIPYINNLDIVERVMIETTPANLAYQLENHLFKANLSENVLPLKVIQVLTKAGMDEERVKLFADYVSSGRGTVEEIETFFKWDAAVRKLYEKTTGWGSRKEAVYAVAYLLEYFTITEMMTVISKNLMYKNSVINVSGNVLFNALADTIAMRKVNGVTDYSMPDDIVMEATETFAKYDVENLPVREQFNMISQEINKKFANIIDGYQFKCPDSPHFFKNYYERVNMLPRKYLDMFLEGKITIIAVGEKNGPVFNSTVFAFDEAGQILPIIGKMTPEQEAAATTLWKGNK